MTTNDVTRKLISCKTGKARIEHICYFSGLKISPGQEFTRVTYRVMGLGFDGQPGQRLVTLKMSHQVKYLYADLNMVEEGIEMCNPKLFNEAIDKYISERGLLIAENKVATVYEYIQMVKAQKNRAVNPEKNSTSLQVTDDELMKNYSASIDEKIEAIEKFKKREEEKLYSSVAPKNNAAGTFVLVLIILFLLFGIFYMLRYIFGFCV